MCCPCVRVQYYDSKCQCTLDVGVLCIVHAKLFVLILAGYEVFIKCCHTISCPLSLARSAFTNNCLVLAGCPEVQLEDLRDACTASLLHGQEMHEVENQI